MNSVEKTYEEFLAESKINYDEEEYLFKILQLEKSLTESLSPSGLEIYKEFKAEVLKFHHQRQISLIKFVKGK